MDIDTIFFDNLGNLYYKINKDTYQVNISGNNQLDHLKFDVNIGKAIEPSVLVSPKITDIIDLERLVDTVNCDGNDETEYLDHLTSECSYLDQDTDERFDFFASSKINNINIYHTDEDVLALYETIIFKDNDILFRSKYSYVPLYRIYIDIGNNEISLKSVGSKPIKYSIKQVVRDIKGSK